MITSESMQRSMWRAGPHLYVQRVLSLAICVAIQVGLAVLQVAVLQPSLVALCLLQKCSPAWDKIVRGSGKATCTLHASAHALPDQLRV